MTVHIGTFARFVRPLLATILCITQRNSIPMYHVFPRWPKKRWKKKKSASQHRFWTRLMTSRNQKHFLPYWNSKQTEMLFILLHVKLSCYMHVAFSFNLIYVSWFIFTFTGYLLPDSRHIKTLCFRNNGSSSTHNVGIRFVFVMYVLY